MKIYQEIKRYNRIWNNVTDLGIELICYKEKLTKEQGGLGALEHFKNCYQILFPERAKSYFSWDELCFKHYIDQYKKGGGCVSVLGGSGSAKSARTGYFLLIDFLASPTDTVILCASTSLADVQRRVWGYVEEAYNAVDPKIIKRIADPAKNRPREIVNIVSNDNPRGGLFSIHIKDDSENDRVKGFHPRRMIIAIDESDAFSPAILGNWTNWIGADKQFLLITLSNPRGNNNLYTQTSEPINGWGSVDLEKEIAWETTVGSGLARGMCIRLDHTQSPVYKNPNLSKGALFFLQRKEITDKLIYGDHLTKGLGLTHPRILQYVRAVPNFTETENSILNQKLIELGKARQKAIFNPKFPIYKLASLDPAFTIGGDECILRFGRLGKSVDNIPILQLEDIISIKINASDKTPSEYQIANFVIEELSSRQIPAKNFCIDAVGINRGIASILEYEWSSDFKKIISTDAPSDRIVDYYFNKKAKEEYDRYVTELWFSFRLFVEAGQIRGLDLQTEVEFCQRGFKQAGDKGSRKTKLETKKEYKLRVCGDEAAKGSPDRADAATYLLELARDFGFDINNFSYLENPTNYQEEEMKSLDQVIADYESNMPNTGFLENFSYKENKKNGFWD